MRRVFKYLLVIVTLFSLTGCGNKKATVETLAENVKKLELTGNLVTYEAYYHNIINYTKPKEHFLEKDRTFFAEYNGTIKLGIDLSKVEITVDGSTIDVKIPKAMVIGEPNVDQTTFKKENFIEDEDSRLNKNPFNGNDSLEAFNKAQTEMKDTASKDSNLLTVAQKRAKALLEETINQLSGLNPDEFTINWEYEK